MEKKKFFQNYFHRNVGGIDRVIRIILGIILLSLILFAFIGPRSQWAYLGLLGLLPLITGIFRFCPPYRLFGINTCKKYKEFNNY